MPKGENSGGRMPPEQHGRQAQAPGVGKNAKRHDLEKRSTPYLHGSDLQQGDVSMLQQGQRIAGTGKQTQQSAKPRRNNQQPQRASGSSAPDPIAFMAGRQLPQFPHMLSSGPDLDSWQPIVRAVGNSRRSSPLLRRLFVRQLRNMSLNPNTQLYNINLNNIEQAFLGE